MISRILLAAALLAAPMAVSAQAWPAKTARIVVPFAPGGTTDVLARMLGKKYTESLGQPFVVENRAGAGGMIGAEFAGKSAPDGYTLLFTSAALSVNTTLFASKVKFDPNKDLAPVIWASSVPLVLTLHPSVPAKSVQELVALSKRQKGGLNGGHNGSGTTSHIAIEMLIQQTGAKVVPIAYKGGGPTTTAVLGGEIDFVFSTLTTVKPHIEAGRVRALAVTTRKPSSVFPKLPTMDSIYPGFESDNWFGMFVPAGTSKDIITRLHNLAAEALKSPEVRDYIAKDGGDIVASTPEELGTHLRNEIARYAKVIKAGNIKSE
ncbi:MAG: tripartite tricarboxylate transporter receptor family protein [Betaproteobacteria bacterium]|jgi:tripartite-type tricarboxylate transporter receptor subunit TctC|nr:tripartite tricarboxylate transporter receptor family protein [Betaproteobacteria bacterium]